MASERHLESFYDATTGERLDLVYIPNGEHAGMYSIRHRASMHAATQQLYIRSEFLARKRFFAMKKAEGRRGESDRAFDRLQRTANS